MLPEDPAAASDSRVECLQWHTKSFAALLSTLPYLSRLTASYTTDTPALYLDDRSIAE